MILSGSSKATVEREFIFSFIQFDLVAEKDRCPGSFILMTKGDKKENEMKRVSVIGILAAVLCMVVSVCFAQESRFVSSGSSMTKYRSSHSSMSKLNGRNWESIQAKIREVNGETSLYPAPRLAHHGSSQSKMVDHRSFADKVKAVEINGGTYDGPRPGLVTNYSSKTAVRVPNWEDFQDKLKEINGGE